MTRQDIRNLARLLAEDLLQDIERIIEEKVKATTDELIPLAMAASESGFSKSYLYKQWANMGGVKVGRKSMISRSNLQAWLQRNKQYA